MKGISAGIEVDSRKKDAPQNHPPPLVLRQKREIPSNFPEKKKGNKHGGQDQHPAGAWLDGRLAICEMVALEILSGAPNRPWYERTHELLESVPWIRMGSAEWRRALEVTASDEGRSPGVRREFHSSGPVAMTR